jgi:hypothetical protein
VNEAPGEVSEVISLIPTNADYAIWRGLGVLMMGLTAASRDIFRCGNGGKTFHKLKQYYEFLEHQFGKIKK